MNRHKRNRYKRLIALLREIEKDLKEMGYTKDPSTPKCPCCHHALEEYLKNIPQSKYISIDVRLDGYEFTKIHTMRDFINVYNRATYEFNKKSSSGMRVKYLNRHGDFTDDVNKINISKKEI